MNRTKKTQQEATWREWVSSWEQSGKSVRAFCLSHRIPAWRLYAWRKRLKNPRAASAVKQQRPRFVELNVGAAGSDPRWCGEVDLRNGRRLRFSMDVPAEGVAKLAAALEGGAC